MSGPPNSFPPGEAPAAEARKKPRSRASSRRIRAPRNRPRRTTRRTCTGRARRRDDPGILAPCPLGPGVYRMIGSRRRSALRRQGALDQEAHRRLYGARAPAEPHRAHGRADPSMVFVTTASDAEALLLEANLIKQLKPRYNVTLRDNKSFPYILIYRDTGREAHQASRRAQPAGDYFGPFASAGAVFRTLNALQRAFLLRTCSDSFYANRPGPACSTRSSAARRPAPGRSRSATTANWSRSARFPFRPEPRDQEPSWPRK